MKATHCSPEPLPQEQLDIANKTRSNLFAWRGQFSPQLVEVLIRSYAPSRPLILDPFVGSGTVLYEAGRLGFEALGAEINPAAIALARVYELINVPAEERENLVKRIDDQVARLATHELPLFQVASPPAEERAVINELVDLVRPCEHGPHRRVLEALVTLLDVYNNRPGPALVRVKWHALKAVIRGLPFSPGRIRAIVSDARRLPVSDSAVDFVLSSPPYINVFNYHQQYRASAELLGADLLRVAKSEIGSNRKHRQNRFLTVVQYCLDMSHVLAELHRACKGGAQILFVVGRESNVRKTSFYNSDIIETLATDCIGLSCPLRQERVFTNRFGLRIYEDILHLIKTRNAGRRSAASPRRVAYYALKSALNRAPCDAKPDLIAAMDLADSVQESPILGECDDRASVVA